MKTATGKNNEMAFSSCIEIPIKRPKKPRKAGRNFSGDWGFSLRQVEDLLEAKGEFLDSVKLAVLTSRLYTKEYVRKKVALYRKNQVDVFPGGMTTEAAMIFGKFDRFLEESKELGFNEIEISESEVTLTPSARLKATEKAVKAGFSVQVELGAHFAECGFPVSHTVKLCKDSINAGASKVCLEGANLLYMKPWENPQTSDQICAIADKVGVENLVFEMNGGLPCVQWLVLTFGPDVNLGNVHPDKIMPVEHIRRGMNISPTWFGKFIDL